MRVEMDFHKLIHVLMDATLEYYLLLNVFLNPKSSFFALSD